MPGLAEYIEEQVRKNRWRSPPTVEEYSRSPLGSPEIESPMGGIATEPQFLNVLKHLDDVRQSVAEGIYGRTPDTSIASSYAPSGSAPTPASLPDSLYTPPPYAPRPASPEYIAEGGYMQPAVAARPVARQPLPQTPEEAAQQNIKMQYADLRTGLLSDTPPVDSSGISGTIIDKTTGRGTIIPRMPEEQQTGGLSNIFNQLFGGQDPTVWKEDRAEEWFNKLKDETGRLGFPHTPETLWTLKNSARGQADKEFTEKMSTIRAIMNAEAAQARLDAAATKPPTAHWETAMEKETGNIRRFNLNNPVDKKILDEGNWVPYSAEKAATERWSYLGTGEKGTPEEGKPVFYNISNPSQRYVGTRKIEAKPTVAKEDKFTQMFTPKTSAKSTVKTTESALRSDLKNHGYTLQQIEDYVQRAKKAGKL